MRHSLPTLALAAALGSASPLLAAFDGAFHLVDDLTPAALYTLDNEVSTLGAWSVNFQPAECGSSFIDTTLAPASVNFGSSTPHAETFSESVTSLFIEFAQDDYVSFTLDLIHQGEGAFSAALGIYLDGSALYSLTDLATTETPVWTYNLGFSVASGQTLEFRSTTISAGTASFASTCATLSNFTVASAIPEPAAFATLLGLAALGLTGRRRRADA